MIIHMRFIKNITRRFFLINESGDTKIIFNSEKEYGEKPFSENLVE